MHYSCIYQYYADKKQYYGWMIALLEYFLHMKYHSRLYKKKSAFEKAQYSSKITYII